MRTEAPPRLGQAFVISAPSGTGKSTLIGRLRQEFPDLAFSVSCTTRSPRQGEVHGQDYFFLTREEFIARRDQGYFAEWAEVHGNLYGTPLPVVRERLDQGQDVLFDIDVQGAAQLRTSLTTACFIFLLPPSYAELEARLRTRGKDDDATIARRLANAADEMMEAYNFGYFVVNDDLDAAYGQLRAVVQSQRLTPAVLPGLVDSILSSWPKIPEKA